MQALARMQSLADRFIQANAPMAIITDLLSTNDLASLKRKMETYDEELKQQQQQAAQAEQEAIRAEREQALEIEQNRLDQEYALEIEKLDREDLNKELDREAKLEGETIRALGMAKNTDVMYRDW